MSENDNGGDCQRSYSVMEIIKEFDNDPEAGFVIYDKD